MPSNDQGFTLTPDERSLLETAIAQADRGELVDGWKLLAELGEPTPMDTVLKRFERPDEIREFEKGRFEVVNLGGLTIGRATYQPGWKWSAHVGPGLGAEYCEVEHVGLVVSGHAVAAFADGTVVDLTPGTLFHIPPTPHDSWVVGDAPYLSLHFLGASQYAIPAADGAVV